MIHKTENEAEALFGQSIYEKRDFKSVFHIPRLISKLKRNMENRAFSILFGCYRIPEAYIYCQLAAR